MQQPKTFGGANQPCNDNCRMREKWSASRISLPAMGTNLGLWIHLFAAKETRLHAPPNTKTQLPAETK
jgi:hypothetical protein